MPQESDSRKTTTGKRDHLATDPDKDDGRDASRRLGVRVSIFCNMKVRICGMLPAPDGPRDVVGRRQVRRVIDEFDEGGCDFRRI